jgi:hypothetical protein
MERAEEERSKEMMREEAMSDGEEWQTEEERQKQEQKRMESRHMKHVCSNSSGWMRERDQEKKQMIATKQKKGDRNVQMREYTASEALGERRRGGRAGSSQ